jgi:predicted dinucleotide-binding enzyme
MGKRNIGIIGGGNVGIAVGNACMRAGHDVVFGLRAGSSSLDDVKRAGGAVVSVEEAAQRDVVVLAVPYRALADTVRAAGGLSGKIVVDASNPLGTTPTSGAEELAALAPGAHIVKAFNTTGFENMENAKRLRATPMMPVCGDDESAKSVVLEIVRDCGFEGVDVGPLKNAALLESLAHLWVTLARRGLGRDWAFAIART